MLIITATMLSSTQIFLFLQKSHTFLTISKVNLCCVTWFLIAAKIVVLLISNSTEVLFRFLQYVLGQKYVARVPSSLT